MDRKGKRVTRRRSRQDKRKFQRPLNKYEMERDHMTASTSAKKLKQDDVSDYSINSMIGYRILNFLTVFTAISSFVKCKDCNSDITFEESSCRGLGFKLVLKCNSCESKYINSCPLIGHAYEVNRRFIFAMRLLGVGLNGAERFCAFMDMPRPIFQSCYNRIVVVINDIIKGVAEICMKKSADQEKKSTQETTGRNYSGLTVSGDGTWMKRGFTSLFGVASLIGFYTNKVLDVVIKSAYCHSCKLHEKDSKGIEYELWKENHAEECLLNHQGAAGKMEVDAVREMFVRSEELYGVQYTTYIGDGDSKTYKAIIDSNPYGDKAIVKKECVNHVKKRMGRRLRQLKKMTKGISGKSRLTDKLIEELCNYYGKAIRENIDSVDKMHNAIWATLHHKGSSDEAPNHYLCPEGENSWCSWQRAKATGNLQNYTHKKPLPANVIDALTPIYTDLSKPELLQRCLGGYTQNNNESFNALIWKYAPKTTSSRAVIVQTATYLAVCLFNEGMKSYLNIVDSLGIKVGPTMFNYCMAEDQRRIDHANARMSLRDKAEDHEPKTEINRPSTSRDKTYYGPGIDQIW